MKQNESIAGNLKAVRETLGDAASVRLVAVSKTVDASRIEEAFRAGQLDFGENKVQEYVSKKKELPDGIRWHFIGRLQTNKVRALLEASPGALPLIHSLDRAELADEIEKQAKRRGIPKVPCLIQINSTGEPAKGGLAPGEVAAFVARLGPDSVVAIQGLMTIGPFTQDETAIRRAFQSVRALREELAGRFPEKCWEWLSMGMSQDYRIAIEEGANMVRIGTAIFGARVLK